MIDNKELDNITITNKIDLYISFLESKRFIKDIPDYQQRIEQLQKELFKDDFTAGNAYLFKDKIFYRIKDKNISYQEYDKIHKEKQIQVLQKILKPNNIENVYRLAKIVKNPYSVGILLSQATDSDNIEHTLKTEYLFSEDENRSFFGIGYWTNTLYKKNFIHLPDIIKELISEKRDTTAINLLFNFDISEQILNILENNVTIQKIYWGKLGVFIPSWIKTKEMFEKVKKYLFQYKRYDLLFDIFGSQSKSIEKYINLDDYMSILKLPTTLSQEDKMKLFNQSLLSWHIENIFNALYNFDYLPVKEMIYLEYTYLPILEHSKWNPKYISQNINTNPESFVELLCYIYKAENEKIDKVISEEEQRIGKLAYKVLNNWKSYPGENIRDEKQSEDILIKWCEEVIKIA
ncbi:hypothetical protein ES705_20951 [subsurface metagenome]